MTCRCSSLAGVGVDSSKDSSNLLPSQRSDRSNSCSREGGGLGLLLNGSHVGGVEGGGGGGEEGHWDVSGGGEGRGGHDGCRGRCVVPHFLLSADVEGSKGQEAEDDEGA